MQMLAFEMQIGVKPADAERVVARIEDFIGPWFSTVTWNGGAIRATWEADAASGRTVGATTAARVTDELGADLEYVPVVVCRAVPTADWID